MRRRCTGVILAGGSASRMGGAAKGLLEIGGRRLVDRVADALRPVTDDLILAGGPAGPHGPLPAVRVVPDEHPGRGPMAGLASALEASGGDILACAWDMPFIPSRLLAALRVAGEEGLEAVLPLDHEGRWQPLCAWYAPGALPAFTRALQAGSRASIESALEGRAVRLLDASTVAQFGDPAMIFLSVNTPADLAWARSRLPE